MLTAEMCCTSEAELNQFRDKFHVDEILRQLELEREKSTRLGIQLQQQISRLLVARFCSLDALWCVSSITGIDRAQ